MNERPANEPDPGGSASSATSGIAGESPGLGTGTTKADPRFERRIAELERAFATSHGRERAILARRLKRARAKLARSPRGDQPATDGAATTHPTGETTSPVATIPPVPQQDFEILDTEPVPPAEVAEPAVPTRRARKAEVALTATMLLGFLELLGTAIGGAEAAMTAEEKAAIEPPLARILMRIDPVANAAIQRWTDPLSLIFALFLYTDRVFSLYAQKNTPPSARERPNEFGERVTIPPADATSGSNGDFGKRVPPAPGAPATGASEEVNNLFIPPEEA